MKWSPIEEAPYSWTKFKFILHKEDKKKEKLNEKHIYNIIIKTELIMGLLWPVYIINFVNKTDNCIIPGTDT